MPSLFTCAIVRWRPAAVLAAACAGLLMVATGAGDLVDEKLRDLRAAWSHHPASGEVHIVEIDAKSIAAFRRWPWPRNIHAAAVDRLHAAGSRLIAFDVDFSSPSDPEEDRAFAASLQRAGRTVILPTFRQAAGSHDESNIESAPISVLAEQSFLAAANVLPEPDGQLRTMPYALVIGGVPRPSLASIVAERPGEADSFFPIDRSIDPLTIPRHSMVDLVFGRIPAEALKGKRVIIGSTAVELGDRFSLPRHGAVPGVVAQALAAETLLAGSPLRPVSGWWGIALVVFLAAFALRRRARFPIAAACASGVVLVLALPPVVEASFALDLPVGPALGALLAAGLVSAIGCAADRDRAKSFADPETGLPNLAALAQDCNDPGDVTIAVARIDDFSALLSAFGAAGAAQLVQHVAARLVFAAASRRVYRLDDATLAWLEPASAPLEDRFAGIDAVMRAPLSATRTAEARLHFGAARGAAREIRQLCADATVASLSAAEQGARWQLFTSSDSEAVNWKVALLSDLDTAILTGQLWNAYQPKLDLRTGSITGVEALVRWDHPDRGMLSPDMFIPIIERHGRGADLTLHVLSQALSDAILWEQAGSSLSVAVNVSATLLHDLSFKHRLEEMIRASRVPPSRVTIELTESVAMADIDAAFRALRSWRDLGVDISIDDYGTGQSSLSYLQKLPATELKIDRSFIAAIAEDERNAILVRSTILLAHELGLRVVAEGVEGQARLEHLREIGCDMVQGYFVSKPLPATAIADFARNYAPLPDAVDRQAG